MAESFPTFEDFWPHYVREHGEPATRRLHFIGTTLVLPVLALSLIHSPLWLLVAPAVGYGFAWIGHFVVEGNRPATFSHPWWSMRGDLRMYRLMLVGRMNDEVRRARGARSY